MSSPVYSVMGTRARLWTEVICCGGGALAGFAFFLYLTVLSLPRIQSPTIPIWVFLLILMVPIVGAVLIIFLGWLCWGSAVELSLESATKGNELVFNPDGLRIATVVLQDSPTKRIILRERQAFVDIAYDQIKSVRVRLGRTVHSIATSSRAISDPAIVIMLEDGKYYLVRRIPFKDKEDEILALLQSRIASAIERDVP